MAVSQQNFTKYQSQFTERMTAKNILKT